jgi:hypothetical protein
MIQWEGEAPAAEGEAPGISDRRRRSHDADRPVSIRRRRSIDRREHRGRSRGGRAAMTQPVNVEHRQHGFAAVVRLRGRGIKVWVREAIVFGVAFAVSLALSVVLVELIRGVI